MRRRPGAVLPIEIDILQTVMATAGSGDDGWAHGFGLAKAMSDRSGANRLTAHGTLYKALARMTEAGWLEDRWEEPDVALAAGRPRRRLYRISAAGQAALTRALSEAPTVPRPVANRIAPA